MTVNAETHIPVMDLRLRLILSRYDAGLEQGELAELMRVSRQSVGNWEAGRNKPSRLAVFAWAGACGVDPVWLETGEPGSGDPGPGLVVHRVGLEPTTRWFTSRAAA